MGAIYSKGNLVLVWLGPHADESELYFDSCNAIASAPRTEISRWRIPKDEREDDTISAPTAVIAALQRRAYWTRTWIIQEIVLAADIHIFCGDRSTHWSNFILQMPDQDIDKLRVGMRNPKHPLGRLSKLRVIGTRLTLRQLLFQCHMSQCSVKRDLIYGLMSLAIDRENVEKIPVDYGSSIEMLFLYTMAACSLNVYDGIPCAQFCDTAATRLSVDLSRSLELAKEVVQSGSPVILTEDLVKKSYFVKMKRFGRVVDAVPVLGESKASSAALLSRYTVREMPNKTLHQLYTSFCPEPTDSIFTVNFESPAKPYYQLACICRPVHHNADEYGVIPYQIIGLGIIPTVSDDEGIDLNKQKELRNLASLLCKDLRSMSGRSVTDGIPGYGIEVTLAELVALCAVARAIGAFVRWRTEDWTVEEQFDWE